MARRESGSSIVFRLTLHLFGQRLRSFIAFDLFLCLLACAGGLVYVERQAAAIVADANDALDGVRLGAWSVERRAVRPDGHAVRGAMQALLPDETAGAWRSIDWDGEQPALRDRVRSAAYTLSIETDKSGAGRYLVVTAAVGPALWGACVGLLIILLWQGFALLGTCFGSGRRFSRILSPLWELTETTRALSTGGRLGPEELQKLAGALDSITASHLDARIPAGKVNAELRPLAQAINQMLERIDEAYRSQMRFVSDASHELRTPIAVIQGYADLLTRWGTEDPETLRESIAAIRSEAAAMKEMVEQLLFLARGDNDSMHLEMERVSLAAVAAEVQREIEMIDKAHLFSADLRGDGVVTADAGLMKQLLRILVDNSVKYTPSGGEIAIVLRQEGEEIRLTVQDEGSGIPADELPHIFDRFYRADRSRTRDTGGTGLGLAIAKWIVEKHRGWFEVTSSPGIGTRMTVCLPAAPKQTTEETGK